MCGCHFWYTRYRMPPLQSGSITKCLRKFSLRVWASEYTCRSKIANLLYMEYYQYSIIFIHRNVLLIQTDTWAQCTSTRSGLLKSMLNSYQNWFILLHLFQTFLPPYIELTNKICYLSIYCYIPWGVISRGSLSLPTRRSQCAVTPRTVMLYS